MSEAIREKGYSENIQLSLPVNPAYVSAVRLTASSIANRMLFDIDEIEDIKAAVSEACTYIIKKSVQEADENRELGIVFGLKDQELQITIRCCGTIAMEKIDGEMSLLMIRALMDEFHITNNQDNHFIIDMIKKHKGITFD